MPELPEVETVRRLISPHAVDRTITDADVRNPVVIAHPDLSGFRDGIVSRHIESISRRGKFLIFHLDDGGRLVLHLRMTGCLLATPPRHPEEKHTHLVLYLDDGTQLRYSDSRRFGRFWLIRPDEPDITGMDSLGPEPWDARMTGDYLYEQFSRHSRSVKECLLDQHLIAGIGNIYSDEILHRSCILPFRRSSDLSREECHILAENIRTGLAFFLDKNSISDEDYLAGRGKDYRNTPYLRVYGRGGGPCLNGCGTVLIKTVVGQRGSVYCPRCQK